METQDKAAVAIAVDEDEDRRSRLIANVSQLDTFSGWGPRMEGTRNPLRGLN